MAKITIQVLEGLERGRVFADIDTPVTIGREDDNSIQLNDERISRFHTKLQEDGDQIILTDLDSTNGTRVNGRPVQLRVLQPGDQLAIGRCLLVFGSAAEIAEHLGSSEVDHEALSPALELAKDSDATISLPLNDPGIPFDDLENLELINLFPGGPPGLPGNLSGLQQAQLSDVIAFVHDRIASVLYAGLADPASETGADNELSPDGAVGMNIPQATWQRLLKLEMDLAVYLRKIATP